MKRISNKIFLIAGSFILFSFFVPKKELVFTISPNSTIKADAKPDKINDFSANVVNTSGEKLNLQWKLVKNTLPKGWDYSMCNYGQCLVGIPKAGKMKTIEKGSKGFLNIHVNPMKIKGTGKVTFYVWVAGNEAQGDTLTYIVSVN